ncbi:Transcription factor IIA alpha/beta subunit [Penicillium chermesinum]|uniref:Transcription factor IIA alpha/beta subunit n=1 Tax=Penicillium chermesinum TaxID=63820 RepID=A0A9W9PHV2_9EURO|nr:Transcription factor IIA alpha/beta subunit [Penicillium chermesinum]KAJ5247115.1 Transcription factor IIA alpha/beta subunit [Penicillium chermesinum]
MSNQQVGPVFERVIQEVCDASQVDFEESGVDQKTLLDMRESVPTPSAPVHAPVSAPGQMPSVAAAQSQPRIKTEPGTSQPAMPPMNPMQMNTNPHAARDRAISNIQQKYGPSAAHSVSQLQAQGQHGYSPVVNNPAHGHMPHIKNEPGYSPLGNGQTDGGRDDPLSDWKAEVARRREAAQNGEGDRMLREYLNQNMVSLEGGGLLRPMSEHSKPSAASRRAARAAEHADPRTSSTAPRIPGQFDGPEEEDEDAINSDLDDPDDLAGDDQDAEEG